MSEKKNNFQLSRKDFKKISPSDFVARIDATEKKSTIAHLLANVKWIDKECAEKAYQKLRSTFKQDFKAGKLVYGNLNEEFREKTEKLAKLIMANFGLTKQEFLTITPEKFVEHIYRYQKKRTIAYLIKKGIPPNIAEEAFWEAVFYFRQRFVNGSLDYDNLSSLFNLNAFQQGLKMIEKKKREEEAKNGKSSDSMNEESFQRMDNALKKLGSKCYRLIIGHFLYGKSWRELAIENKPILSKKIENILEKLYAEYQANKKTYEEDIGYPAYREQHLNGENWKRVKAELTEEEAKDLAKKTAALRQAGKRCMDKLRKFIFGK